VVVIEFSDNIDMVTADMLQAASIPAGTKRLLVKTRNSILWGQGEMSFQKDFVAVSPNGAEWLVRRGINLIGVDYLSVAPYGCSDEPHTILLQAGVIILEGVDLSGVTPGDYLLYCLPLKLTGSDGAPARVILVK
jgi:arylformamidase